MTETQQKRFQDYFLLDHMEASVTNFMKNIQDLNIAALKEADTIMLIARWTKPSAEEIPTKQMLENIFLLASSTASWTRIGQIRTKEIDFFQELIPQLIVKLPINSQSREGDYIHRLEQKDYVFFRLEVDDILNEDLISAYETADLLEKAMNIVKIKEEDPLESRKIEDLQWSLIEAKRKLLELKQCRDEETQQKKAELEEIVHDLQDKILACEKTERALAELGVAEAMKEVTIEKVPTGRVKLGWTKSG